MKYVNDIRSTSSDSRYLDSVGFVGLMDDAVAQSKAAPDFGPAKHGTNPTERLELLTFLRVPVVDDDFYGDDLIQKVEKAIVEDERDTLNDWIGFKPELGIHDPGFFGLENARARGWLS